MTIFCDISTPFGRLSGRLDAVYSNDEAPLLWQGDIHLLKSPQVPAWLHDIPDKLDANTFESSVVLIAEALGGTVEIKQSGIWEAPDEVITATPSLTTRARPRFRVGDTVKVHTRFKEGEMERVQVFNGIVVARHGRGLNESFTVRRVNYGESVERKFPINSPRIEKIEVKNAGLVGYARFSHLMVRRPKRGKATTIKERSVQRKANQRAAYRQSLTK